MAEKATFLISWAQSRKPNFPTRYLYGTHLHFASNSIIIALLQNRILTYLLSKLLTAQSFNKNNASIRFAEFVPCLPVLLTTIIFLQKDTHFTRDIQKVILLVNSKIPVPTSPLYQHLQIWRSGVTCPIKFISLETEFGQELSKSSELKKPQLLPLYHRASLPQGKAGPIGIYNQYL